MASIETRATEKGFGLWLLDIATGIPEDEYRFWQTFLTPERRERLGRFHFRADAERSLAGEILARGAVAAALACPPSLLRFTWSALGKPVVAGGAHFNLSHSGSLVVCAVSDRPVGVDVEYAAEALDPDICRHFASSGEMRFLGAPGAPEKAGTVLWTLKESLLKATGTGIVDTLRDIDFSAFLEQWSGGAASFCAHGFAFSLFFRDEYAVAVCRRHHGDRDSAVAFPEAWVASLSCGELAVAIRRDEHFPSIACAHSPHCFPKPLHREQLWKPRQ